jgi:cupin fold WbuC family metalloprotein
MRVRRVGDGVYAADQAVVAVGRPTIEWLKGLAASARRRRARLCAHRDAADPLHEMLIALHAATYVRPHRHPGKTESFHVVEGALTVVLFAEDGRLRETISLGDFASGRPFFYRLSEPTYHTVVVESPMAVIHETTNGPFDRAATEYAAWSPAEEDTEAGRRYLREVAASVGVHAPFAACPVAADGVGAKTG